MKLKQSEDHHWTGVCLARNTELYRINRERHRFLGNEAESQQHFVAFAAPSSGKI